MDIMELFLGILNSCLESELYTRQILMGVEFPSFQMDKEITELTGIEQVYILKYDEDDKVSYENLGFITFKALHLYGNSDLINFYFNILNSKYCFESIEKVNVFITSVGRQDLELNSLSALFCYYDVKFHIDSSVYSSFKNLYNFKTFRNLGNSISYKCYTDFYDFIVASNLNFDCMEFDVYDIDNILDFFMLFIDNDTLNNQIKSFNIILNPMIFDGTEDIDSLITFVKSFDKINLFNFYTYSNMDYDVIYSDDFFNLSAVLSIKYLDIDVDKLKDSPNSIYSVLDNRYY